jgi:hypothetical protein
MRKRFSKVATTAVAAAGISAVAVTAGFGSHAAEAATNPQRTSGLQLDAFIVPAPQSASSVAAAFASHAVGATKAAPADQAPAAPAKAAPAPAKPAIVKLATVKVATAKHAHIHHAPAAPAKPYHIFDSVTPSDIPAHQNAAVYSNGAYAATPAQVAGHRNVLWIDTNGSNPHADALDVEPGDATPAGAAQWVHAKLNADHKSVAIVYTMISQWQAVKDNVSGLPHWMQDKVRYWIADPTGVDHVVPGANATQWYWGKNYDTTTANPGFQS